MHKKIVFRVDAAKLTSTGTGSLYRSVFLSKILKKKYNLKKNDLIFIVKTDKEYSIAKKILIKNNIQFQKIGSSIKDYSSQELKILQKYSSELIIIDRYMGKITKKFIIQIKKSHKKIFLLDDVSKIRILADLSINPMSVNFLKTKSSNIGYRFNILPSFDFIKKKIKKRKNEFLIFIFFGGYDKKKLTYKLLKGLIRHKLNVKYLVNEKFKKDFSKINQKKISFFKSQNHYKNLSKADISINNGGLGMMDAIALKKPTICIPQYKHQKMNIDNLFKIKVIFKAKISEFDKIIKFIEKIRNKKINMKELKLRQNKTISLKTINNTFKLIFRTYEKQIN